MHACIMSGRILQTKPEDRQWARIDRLLMAMVVVKVVEFEMMMIISITLGTAKLTSLGPKIHTIEIPTRSMRRQASQRH